MESLPKIKEIDLNEILVINWHKLVGFNRSTYSSLGKAHSPARQTVNHPNQQMNNGHKTAQNKLSYVKRKRAFDKIHIVKQNEIGSVNPTKRTH